MNTYKKHPLITGTLLLSATGVISRIIGFFYRIYLSKLFGEEGMGIYQLLSPVLSLGFSLSAAAYQTATSKLVAEYVGLHHPNKHKPLIGALCLSFPLSLLCLSVTYLGAKPIGIFLLKEPRTIPLLQILAFSFPFSAIHACINGYFYGNRNAGIPALSQLAEQLVRVGCVSLLVMHATKSGNTPSVKVAVIGMTIGEVCSMLIVILAFFLLRDPVSNPCRTIDTTPLFSSLFHLVLPLTANRLTLNLLQSIESVSIPQKLQQYGYDTATSLSVYGVLTGMAFPLILFPNALTSSMAVLLLPLIAQRKAGNEQKALKESIRNALGGSFLMGCICCLLFALFGNFAGRVLFHSKPAGYFITGLSFLCPFLYLDTTLSGILQGLGRMSRIFRINLLSLCLRLLFVLYGIPRFGIRSYLWGLIAGQLLQCILYLYSLHESINHPVQCVS